MAVAERSFAEAVEAPALVGLPGLRHGFFTRRGGVSDGLYGSLNIGIGSNDVRERVVENRARVAARLGVAPDRLVTPYQVHSPDVAVVRAPWSAEERPNVDAVVTDVPGLAIGVSTADCGPILFADAEAGVVGAAHAGWRGAFTGVIEATIAAMEQVGARRAAIVAVLGPTISRAAYEVGPEFIARFVEADSANAAWFTPSERDGHAMFDLPGYILSRLGKAGIGSAHDLGLCTYADEDRFFSFRRTTHRGEPDYGRLIAAIALQAA
ncbi:peptidoglycan editing factor PgeF [Segnochrobactrum spirostomi]|uniref:Purine nucleoside phosphorylase n=1 Tax=Segnochrobactrum spirostomi TaxID=2608987 RepID=A0A6A7Y2B0_9HYPH|nr:peptidoglycan editing factor PgeF [Segnochrobactrum spirostomi]MQT12261.1 peptidoglycan editing factor PgeF [Segnochrobactrum spirostomi]